MALGRNRKRDRGADYWPGFVDALSTLLIAIMFLLTVFVVAQFVLSREISGKDEVLNRLNNQIAELTQMLALEKGGKQDLEDALANLQSSLDTSEKERSRLQSLLDTGAGNSAQAQVKIGELSGKLDEQQQVSARAMSQIDLLNQQIAALRAQIAAVEQALQASEAKDQNSQAKIADLGRRLNVALAQKVQELNRYRSDFFGRLREILSDRQNIRIVGDRFVFQSEVLFPSGGADMNPQGQEEMVKLANALIDLAKEIPPDINWVLRVDGHTDNVQLSGNGRYPDNWALSAARAVSVVKFLISKGVPADRLAAAGFGEFQPIAPGDTPEARAQNRRIELKLTER
ncbi:peptidoglycan -binding protein [Agrobacterium vitis]|uniref:Flagellar motor protein n=2 Tax=Rhizobium/Agrobacterium group TaxID=227290 RepID=B9JS11_ALLAM|nr:MULTISPECIES: peptidoglycan -binding protein [Rhizobium/Agrobacterium group]ACM37639.1 flagellar motor protein [Allorhizobium ampelinum S4]KAA3517583.1 peptidoglycan -binding protein [Agrobacterium vitis]KAA3526984.1 peptidoglycan -binding protein [Agrobacterium vitis]MBF2715003.1 peptidoglycan -binding protein [Agrobacterium vitis]MCE6074284.1 peptidoglycan -binding protein [Agrobacterium vitis]